MVELLGTKFYIPRIRSNLVSRPRLIERLNTGLDKKLTVIAAPVGFGKTTLLSEWIPQSTRKVSWLSLDDSDNDPTRFWVYFIKSLQQLHQNLGSDALSLLQSPQALPITSVLTSIINDIAALPDDFALVLDDYHVIDFQPIHDALAFMIDHLPVNLHIVISTRVDPPLPLARMRIRDNINEFRINELRFISDEVSAFLNKVMGLNLSIDDVAALEARTEGWIAGLQIAALSMRGRDDIQGFIKGFSGSHRHILGYLAEEVLNHQTGETLNFLLQTSILDRLCAPLCDAVTKRTNSQSILERLERTNLFLIPLDDEQHWYRYHHLFTEVLRARLKGKQPDQLPELHRRASQWLETSGRTAEAIDQAIYAMDYPRAACLISSIIQSYNDKGAVRTLLNWIDQLPEEQIFQYPDIFSYKGWLLYLAGRIDQAKDHADKAKVYITPDTPTAARGRLAHLDSQFAIAKGDMSAVQAFAQDAIALIGEEDFFFRILALMTIASAQTLAGSPKDAISNLKEAARIGEKSKQAFATLTAYAKLANQLNLQGSLQEARAVCQHAMTLYQSSSGQPLPISSIAYVEAAKLAYEEDDMDVVEQYFHVATRLESNLSIPGLHLENLYIQALFEGAKGNLNAALELAGQGHSAAEQMGLRGYIAIFTAVESELLLRQGDITALMGWIASAGPTFARCDDLLNMYGSIVYVRFLIHQGDLRDTAELITRMEEAARRSNYVRQLITLLLLKALLCRSQGDSKQAQASLEEALQLAMPQKYRRVFLDEGEPIRNLLLDYHSIVKRKIGIRHDGNSIKVLMYIDQLLAAFPHSVPSMKLKAEIFPESLSERELEILRLVASGRSNQEIAEILVIAVSTVKSHINNLYAKLGTNRRTQAIAIANELGLLSE